MPVSAALRQPPPLVAAVFNAAVGLFSPIAAMVLLMVVRETRNEGFDGKSVAAGILNLASMAMPGALVGLLACIGLAWATPAKKHRVMSSCLIVALAFGVGSALGLGGRPFGISLLPRNFLTLVGVAAACGALMAWSIAHAARSFGAIPVLSPAWIAMIGAAVAGLGLALSYAGAHALLAVLPAFWLGTVTYASLKSRPGV